MSLRVILRILGLLLMLFSLTMLPPTLMSLWFRDGVWSAFISGMAISVATGLLLYLPNRRSQKELRIRDGFIIAAMFWTVLALFGSLPLMLFGESSLNITDAVFESFSGLTTTGATVITGIDFYPNRFSTIASNFSGWAGWGSWFWRSPYCPPWALAAWRFIAPKSPGR